ncbi:MAG: hypothetical protein J5746_05505 [Victivallales bacterium]|nr:hypothetical protein [Victivallales bacterium]
MAKSSLILAEGEELLAVVEGEMWANSGNAMANFMAHIRKILFGICGYKKTAQLCITNKRVVVESHETCTCNDIASSFCTLLPQSVASIDSVSVGTGCFGLCCKKHSLVIVQNSGAEYGFVLKGGKEEIAKTSELIMNVLVR